MAVFHCPYIFCFDHFTSFLTTQSFVNLVVFQVFVNKKKDRRASILFQPN